MSGAKPTLRAAVYARVSTSEQVDGTSLDEQVEVCTAEIHRQGWSLDPAHVFIDAGISGKDDTRPAWNAMLKAARTGEVQAVVVRKLDRFARNAGHTITETDRLQKLGVRLVVVDQGIDMGTPQGKLMRTMLAGVAEMEADLITSRTVAGMRALARQGRLPGGEPPYGWKRERLIAEDPKTSRVVPDEAEREVLRLGYDLLVKRRLNAYQVAMRFNDAGIRPRKADRWSAEVVRRIWRNPTLANGKVSWGLAKNSEAGGQRRHKTKVNHDGTPRYGEPITVDIGNPVFTAAEHRALVRALERRVDLHEPNAPVARLLTGRVFTAEGHPMYGVNLPREQWQGAYRCSNRRARNAERCSCPQLRALPMEELVWAEVMRVLSDPARLEAAARAYLALPDEGADVEADQQAMDGVRAEVERFERGLAKAERGVLLADTPEDERRQAELVAELRRELTAARQRLAGYEALVSSVEARGQALRDVAALAERARGRLHTMSEVERAEVVRILQVSVVCSGPVVAGVPESVVISGVVDPRMWGTDAPEAGAKPSYRSGEAQSPLVGAGWPPWHSRDCSS